MKGFYIDVTNNLIDPKHCDKMGESVWLFMLLLDKITSISEDGIGNVNGSRPFTYEMFEDELGKSESTFNRWVKTLRESGYISTQRTREGLIFFVSKAKKRFGRTVEKDGSENSRVRMTRTVVDEGSDLTITITGQESTLKNIKRKEIKEKRQSLLVLWNSLGLTVHENWPESQNGRFDYLLKNIGYEEIEKTVKLYAAVYKDPSCFFSFKWSLSDFIQRRNGLEAWAGKTIADYKTDRKGLTIRTVDLTKINIKEEIPF